MYLWCAIDIWTDIWTVLRFRAVGFEGCDFFCNLGFFLCVCAW